MGRHHFEEHEGGPVLVLAGTYTVEHAGDLLEILRAALDRHDSLTIDCTAVEQADLTFIQLLRSAAKTCGGRGGTVSSRGAIPEAVRAAASRVGLNLEFMTTNGSQA